MREAFASRPAFGPGRRDSPAASAWNCTTTNREVKRKIIYIDNIINSGKLRPPNPLRRGACSPEASGAPGC